ncbi:hypothetical protein [Wohlfahrtiimonas populi]|uniref:hypothetical protein n=1 Tax=Wohlfahrtiimonas populi TaxID=1940240 RepID=UPI00098D3E50|nr:hypothetical protein [Wohlfahrtiimonas populi]
MQDQELIQLLQKVTEEDASQENTQKLLENINEISALPVFLPNMNGEAIDENSPAQMAIEPFITVVSGDTDKTEIMCVHLFLDKAASETYFDEEVLSSTALLETNFAWSVMDLPKLLGKQKMPYMFVYHYSDLESETKTSLLILTEVMLPQIERILTVHSLINTPTLSKELWGAINVKKLKQYGYQFALNHPTVDRVWMCAMGAFLYIVVDGSLSNEQEKNFQSEVQLLLKQQVEKRLSINVDVIVQNYKDIDELIKEGIESYGGLVFDKSQTKGMIGQWFNARRLLPVLVAPELAE